MFGSQLLEVLIGLALVMFTMSVAASTTVEAISGFFGTRARMLGEVLRDSLGAEYHETAAFKALTPMSGKRRKDKSKVGPSYVSRPSFEAMLTEVNNKRSAPPDQKDQDPAAWALSVASADAPQGPDPAIAPLFEETMNRASGVYKRWSSTRLFVVGFVLAMCANVSVFHVVESLWNDPVTRGALTEAAANVGAEGDLDPTELESVALTIEQIDDTGLPVGWDAEARTTWDDPFSFKAAAHFGGWLVTGILVTAGAPMWFDVLGGLVNLRFAGRRPKAEEDTGGQGDGGGGA